jgi:hypothetical protein
MGVRFLLFMAMTLASSPVWAQAAATRAIKPISRLQGRTGVLFDVGIYYGQTEASANPAAGNTWQNTTSIYDVKLGYVMENSVFFGAEYSTRNDNQTSATTTSGGGAGVGFGYFAENGFNVRAYYKFGETYGNYSSGSGYQADLGYMVNMSSNFYLGAAISIRQTMFTSNSTITGFDYWTRKETYPVLSFGFSFN